MRRQAAIVLLGLAVISTWWADPVIGLAIATAGHGIQAWGGDVARARDQGCRATRGAKRRSADPLAPSPD